MPPAYWRGRRLQRGQRWREAIDAYRAALPSPDDAEVQFRIGYACEKQGDLPAALDSYAEAVRDAPDAPPIRPYRLGFVADALREWEVAATAYRAAIAAGGTVPNWFYRLGRVLERLERWREAGEAYAQAIRRGGDRPAWRSRLFRTCCMTGDWRGVSAYYRRDEAVVEGIAPLLDAPASELTPQRVAAALAAGETGGALPAEWWQSAYVRLFNLGRLHEAYAAKRLAVARARQRAEKGLGESVRHRLDAAASCIDQTDYGAALELLRPLTGGTDATAEEAREMAAGACLMAGDVAAAAGRWRFTEADRPFRRLIEGKRVAIVGAANSGLEAGAEIDSADIVIRTNFLNPDSVAERAALTGARTDISYYNFAFEEKNRARILAVLRQNPLKAVVLHQAGYGQASAAYAGLLPVRRNYLFRGLYGFTAYAIPRILYDVLRCRPAQVRLYNSDFFLGKDIHYRGYLKPGDYPNHDPEFVFMMSYHDILRNFLFTRRLYDLGLCSGDAVCAAVLALSPGGFLDRMTVRVGALRPPSA
ncbi:MAG: tetratricopeptide repeat protein [Oceanibaculum nanhaiense]|uniref:tetratricopeptide repeat protein n=1 Tax=Oceanibaculum nanhaiense TaxID=1909734 RepID=UPI0025A37D93|nr:tetratricopeptide repeat protein [Oceanibaculum nanhaiense]MDM7947745.1 tetratricopeptide repeat protein [Oceanibaculum nanhaiense]